MRYVFVEIFRFFWLTLKTPEWPKKDPKNSKNCKIFQFYAIFVKLSMKLLALNVENNPERKNCYPRGFFKEIQFFNEKMPQIWTEIDKILENSDFWNIYAIFVHFSKDLVA